MKTTLAISRAILVLGLVASHAETNVNGAPFEKQGGEASNNLVYIGNLERYLLPEKEKASFTSQCQLLRKNPNYGKEGYYNSQEWLPTGDAYLTDNKNLSDKIEERYAVTSAAHELSYDMNEYGNEELKFKNIDFNERVKLNCDGNQFFAKASQNYTKNQLNGEFVSRDDVAFLVLENQAELTKKIENKPVIPMRIAGLPTEKSGHTADPKFDKKLIENFLNEYELVLVSRANQGYDPKDSKLYISKCKNQEIDFGGETLSFNCNPGRDMSGGVVVYAKKSLNGVGEILKDSNGHVLVAAHKTSNARDYSASQYVLMRLDDVSKAMK